MVKPKKPLDVYVRVSRVAGRTGDGFISPKVQEERCRAMATAKGLVVGQVLTDLDQSGGKMDRPALNEALERIKAGTSGGLIVATSDRFARSLTGALDTMAQITEAGGVMIACDGDYDTSTASGRLIRDFLLRLNQYYREQVTEKWAESTANALGRGVYITARVPFGYRKNRGRQLVQDETAAPLVQGVYRMRGQGASCQACANYLNEQGARTPMLGNGTGKTGGGNPWSEGAVRKLVANPIYKGKPPRGEHMPESARKELQLVSARVWDAAQPAGGGHRAKSPEGALLGGILRCGECGGVLTPQVNTKRRVGGTVVRTVQYRCRQRAAHAAKCPSPITVSGALIEPHVTEAVLSILSTYGRTMTLVDDPRREQLSEELADREHDLNEVLNAEDELTPLAYGKALARAERARDAVAKELAALPQQGTDERQTSREDIERTWERMSVPERRRLIASLIAGITVRRAETRTQPIAERLDVELTAVAA